MGTLLGWLRFRSARRLAGRMPPALRRVKYVLLGAVVVLAALGNLTLLVLDPLALLTRTTTTSVIPGFVYLVDALERAGMTWGPTVGVVQWTEETLRGTVLPTIQPRYEQGIALFLVLLAIVLLNALADRFWCRYLCPLGALLGLVAKVQLLRPVISDGCGACGACATACRLDAIEVGGRGASRAAAKAPPRRRPPSSSAPSAPCASTAWWRARARAASRWALARPGPWAEYDPGRREVVIAAAAGVGAALLFGTGVARAVKRPGLIRPPGAQDEARFLSRCLRCSECMKACPTSGLQPTLGEAGLEGLWTPVLKSRLGYCDYACTACGQVCPSGAIPPLPLERKRAQVLGVAVIDRDRCLPWAAGTPCIVCQEMCPVPDKAIVLQPEREVVARGRRHGAARAAGGGREPLHRLRHLRVQVPAGGSRRDRDRAGEPEPAQRSGAPRLRPDPTAILSRMSTDDRTLADLRAAALFRRLDEDQLERLSGVAQARRLGADETLFLQGDAADAFYLLAEGRLKVFKLLRDGRTATVRHVEPGQTFAEAALFHETFPSSTETLTDCLLYRFDKDATLALLLAEPQLAVNLLAAMAHLLGLLNRRVEELLLPVPARLARYLLARADEQLEPVAAQGDERPDVPRVIQLPVSKRELAARLGTVPETLSRTFDRFKRAQVVRMSGDHRLIEILSFDQLHRLAQE